MMLDKMVASSKRVQPAVEVEVLKFSGDATAATKMKPISMLQVQAISKATVAWVDCDMLIRKPLIPLMESVTGTGLAVMHRPDLDERFKFNTGLVCVGYSLATAMLMRHWLGISDTIDSFLGEQTALWRAYQKMSDSIVLSPLPDTYNDCHFRPGSHVWHAKGKSLAKHATQVVLDEWGIDENNKVRN